MVNQNMVHPRTTICQLCGADWEVLRDCLYDTLNSENLAIALTIIDNCDCCSAHFVNEVARIKQIFQSAKERLSQLKKEKESVKCQ